MRVLSDHERSHVCSQVVEGLQRLGLGAEITPGMLDAQMERVDRALAGLGIQSLRAAQCYTPPDPYAAGLAKMKKEQR